jgi:hypothetical protein
MLGRDYPGYFAVGDANALAQRIARCRDDPPYLAALERVCRERMTLFLPERERDSLASVLRSLAKAA